MGRPALNAGQHGEITIVKRGTSFEARCRVRGLDGIVRQTARRGPTKGIAKARLIDALGDAAANRPDRTLSFYLDAWVALKRRQGLAQRSIEKYEGTARGLKELMGGVRPADLTPGMIQAKINTLGPGAAKTALTAMHGAIAQAAKDGALDRTPMLGVAVEAPRKPVEPRALTMDEYVAFRAHMASYAPKYNTPDPLFMSIFDWVAGTGCRISEALGVMGEHVRMTDVTGPDGQTLKVQVWRIAGTSVESTERGVFFQEHTKGHDKRAIVLPKHLADMAPLYGLAFPSKAGKLRALSAYERAWAKRTRGSQWEWVTPKTLRKTVATLLAQSLDVEAARLQLGHADERMTIRHYIQPVERLVDHREQLGRIQSGE